MNLRHTLNYKMKTVGRYNGFKQGKNADLGLVGYDTLGAV
jgi:hypothetical protein